jgi:hypothetical protein
VWVKSAFTLPPSFDAKIGLAAGNYEFIGELVLKASLSKRGKSMCGVAMGEESRFTFLAAENLRYPSSSFSRSIIKIK